MVVSFLAGFSGFSGVKDHFSIYGVIYRIFWGFLMNFMVSKTLSLFMVLSIGVYEVFGHLFTNDIWEPIQYVETWSSVVFISHLNFPRYSLKYNTYKCMINTVDLRHVVTIKIKAQFPSVLIYFCTHFKTFQEVYQFQPSSI